MTVIQKLSDRDNLIFDAIKLILVNEGELSPKQIQYKLFECGIYCNGTLMKQALSVMDSKGLLTRPEIKTGVASPKVKDAINEISKEVLPEESKA
jgi:hypothetical protein